MPPQRLEANILETYFALRSGIVVLSVLLPIVLYVGGRLHGDVLLPSMSAYYGANGGLMRDWFVGILWAVGSFLFLYRGYSSTENLLLNCAGVAAVALAMIPCNCWTDGATSRLHAICALTFFMCMASVCLFCARDTVGLLPKDDQARYRRAYRVIGLLLVVSPVVATVVGGRASYKFFVEMFGVYMFAAYWLVKSRELSITCAERRAAEGRIENIRGLGVVSVAGRTAPGSRDEVFPLASPEDRARGGTPLPESDLVGSRRKTP